jgi:NAD(P)-dependent dehydrogenase (short-subunit alcohol dehydrogenase family)
LARTLNVIARRFKNGEGEEHNVAPARYPCLDLRDQNMIVTGDYGGLGLEAVGGALTRWRQRFRSGARRDQARNAIEAIPRVHIDELDLMNSESIDAFANRIATRFPLCTRWSIALGSWRLP